ncbi:MAG: hypothetical protein RIS20_775 [Bacteroidota bacterium]|jgi:hypothetical protein
METIEKFRIIATQHQFPKAFILEYFNLGERLNLDSVEQMRSTSNEVINLLSTYNLTPDQSHFLRSINVLQKLYVSHENYDKYLSDESIYDIDFTSGTFNEEKMNASREEMTKENKKNLGKSYLKIFGTVFIVVFLLTVFVIWLFKPNVAEIRGESPDSYIVMDSKCGCDSQNGESKREVVFNSEYKDKWVTYFGTIESIHDNKLSVNADLSGVSDLSVEFENEKDIYNLKNGSFVAVKFVLREQGGCFSDYEGDMGKIISTDMVEINKMIH